MTISIRCCREHLYCGSKSGSTLGGTHVTLDLGRLPQACYLGDSGKRDLRKKEVSIEELEYAQNALGEFGGNNRTGIAGTLHRISAIRNKNGRVVGLTCRLGRPVREIIDMTRDLLEYGKSILFLGRPGVGKTRVIRGISHVLSYELLKRVAVKKPLVCCDKLKQATTSRAIINQKNSNSHGGDIAAVLLLHFCPAAAAAFCSCCCCCAAAAPAAAVLLLLLLHFLLLMLLLLHYYSAAAAAFRPAAAAATLCCCVLLLLQLRFANAAAVFCCCCSLLRGSNPMVLTGCFE
ncbi:UNVERIFIED_CONTAM: putative protein ycf45 [Sesamum angustifolium]|uniref:Uncharacterized protein n=1 Tax=Sesamum angustifolium TaxID=2727405 RepID=A0AAW2L6V0_9LAMI